MAERLNTTRQHRSSNPWADVSLKAAVTSIALWAASATATLADPPLPTQHPKRLAQIAPNAQITRNAQTSQATQITETTAASAAASETDGTKRKAAPTPESSQPETQLQPNPETTADAKAEPKAETPTEPEYRLAKHHLMGEKERDFRNTVRAAVRDLSRLSVDPSNAKALKTIARAVRRNKPADARAQLEKLTGDIARKLGLWMVLRTGSGSLAEYRAFLVAHPDWPSRALLRKRMEDVAFTFGGTVGEIEDTFKLLDPTTGPGIAALASAKQAVGKDKEARALAARAWRQDMLPNNFETGFLERFGDLLTPEDHKARVDRLLGEFFFRKRLRRSRANRIRRVIPLLSTADQKAATARLSLYLGQSSANRLVASLPAAARKDPEFARQRAQNFARQRKYEKAAAQLAKTPAGQSSPDPDGDWDLRQRVARELLELKKYKSAYDTVKDARPDDENDRKDAAFLSGWIALQKLKNLKFALKHFEVMTEAADGPLSRSKASYWLGRAHLAAGDTAAARKAFLAGGAFRDTFHGALSRVALEPAQRSLAIPLPPKPTDAEIKAFQSSDLIKAAVLADKADLPRGFVRSLFGSYAWRTKSVGAGGEIILSAALAELLGDGQIAVRAGKAGVARGYDHFIYSYPLHRLPAFAPITDRTPPPEILLGIARQESEFNTRIVSRVGARGVLQVMPITAKDVCQIYKVRCNVKRLLTDATYNTRIAAAYIATQMRVVEDNMILTLTSYNAGPGRTRQWLRERGDPRTEAYDALDWVYAIPFQETRLYVQKVLSNLQVYRARLSKPEPIQVDRELGIDRPNTP
ncbi:MAG: transglycosylase SLT domain-containing protein [Pseudomonadota bacterium]